MCNVFLFFLSLWLQVPNLTPGAVYQFRVYAANVIGLSNASAASAPFICEAWNMPEPGNRQHKHAEHYRNTLPDAFRNKNLVSFIFHWIKEVYESLHNCNRNLELKAMIIYFHFETKDYAFCLTQRQIKK